MLSPGIGCIIFHLRCHCFWLAELWSIFLIHFGLGVWHHLLFPHIFDVSIEKLLLFWRLLQYDALLIPKYFTPNTFYRRFVADWSSIYAILFFIPSTLFCTHSVNGGGISSHAELGFLVTPVLLAPYVKEGHITIYDPGDIFPTWFRGWLILIGTFLQCPILYQSVSVSATTPGIRVQTSLLYIIGDFYPLLIQHLQPTPLVGYHLLCSMIQGQC